MNSLKTRKSAIKRIKIKKNFLQRKKAYNSHLFLNKNSKRLQYLSKLSKISAVDNYKYLKLIPYKY